jgi:hypothetical protein
LSDKELSPSGEDGEVFTSSLETSHPLMMRLYYRSAELADDIMQKCSPDKMRKPLPAVILRVQRKL